MVAAVGAEYGATSPERRLKLNGSYDKQAPVDAAASVRPAMRVSGVTRDFGSGRGVYDTSFELLPCNVLGFIGANASGKSTLLRCATLFDMIDRGTVEIQGKILAHRDRKEQVLPSEDDLNRIRRNEIGVVFQDSRPWPHLTVRTNVTLALEQGTGLSRQAAFERAELILKQFGLEDRTDSLPCELSGGLRQRLVLARSLAVRPSIIAIDEGTSALDPDWTEKVRVIIKQYANSGAAVLLISHQMGFVRRLSDKVCFLHQGRIHEIGTPEDIFDHPKSQELQEFLANA